MTGWARWVAAVIGGVALVGVVACGESGTAAPGAIATVSDAPVVESKLPETSAALSLRFMSYNVLMGGGLDRRFDSVFLGWQHPIYDGRNRFADIMAVIETADPDVLAIEEAAGWDEGRPSVVEQVATTLGMNYVIVKNPYNLNVVIFSKLPILNSFDLVEEMGSNGALVATLQAPDGSPIVVAAAHLDPFTSQMRGCQLGLILDAVAPAAGQRLVLMGDMNFRSTSPTRQVLLNAGWQTAAIEETLTIDQIWIAPGSTWTKSRLWEPGSVAPNLSDHYPVGARIDFAAQKGPESLPKLSPPAEVCTAS